MPPYWPSDQVATPSSPMQSPHLISTFAFYHPKTLLLSLSLHPLIPSSSLSTLSHLPTSTPCLSLSTSLHISYPHQTSSPFHTCSTLKPPSLTANSS
ncbi:hypothetical protein CRYUN_Cryun22dG0062100 [Craigia yunnanensis]